MADIIEINGKEIKVNIRSYKNANKIKMYFKQDILYISKPKYVSIKKVKKLIEDNHKEIYEQYKEITSKDNIQIKHWYTGEKILYKGEEYKININNHLKNTINVSIDMDSKVFYIVLPENIEESQKGIFIKKALIKLFQKNTKAMLNAKVDYWSQITNIDYNSFTVRDATTKFGSCIPTKKKLHFSSRLIMLPEEAVDSIIIHELCHIIHPNHSKDFYNLIKKFMPNYDEISKWLKKNSYHINI